MARETREDPEMEVCEATSPSSLKLYETQFFGFTPQTCILRVCSAFQDCLYDILPVVEKVCVRQLRKGGSENEEQLQAWARDCSLKLQRFLVERFKHLSGRMEALLASHCFSVPPNVLLPEDRSHKDYPQDFQEVLKLESSLDDLHKAYEAEVCARQALLAELEEQKEVQAQLDRTLEWMRELRAAWVKEGNGNFDQSFRLVMESLQKLQEAVGEVQVCSRGPH
ncbi:protein MIS12 homolog [Salarias fasciatus]|uniref:Protein MIS12 homolog n=1 Tax=Salarias fasciatus TaxID=181472 RepID=A0A672GJD1_SALFA|nr:protein MIS12 homolog [Salarias fasciatus]